MMEPIEVIMGESKRCLDCDALLHGTFCSECGQKRTDMHRSIGLLIKEFFKDQFSLDAKLVKTFKPLVTAPGQLTSEYLEGKRTRYLPPLKLYLVISVLFFFLRTVVFVPDSAEMIARMEENLTQMSEFFYP